MQTTSELGTTLPAEWAGWLTAVAGIWILVSPFALTGSIATGTAMWSNVGGGLVALVLAAYAGYALHAG